MKETINRTESVHPRIDFNSLGEQTKSELLQLAKDLSNGIYQKNSEQREKLLQMIAAQLAESRSTPP